MSHVIDKPIHARRLPEQSEWTIELIEQAHDEVRRVAHDSRTARTRRGIYERALSSLRGSLGREPSRVERPRDRRRDVDRQDRRAPAGDQLVVRERELPGTRLTRRHRRLAAAVEPPGQRRTHIHVRRAGSFSEQFPLLFRDFLRADPAAALDYGQHKQALAARLARDRRGYLDAIAGRA